MSEWYEDQTLGRHHIMIPYIGLLHRIITYVGSSDYVIIPDRAIYESCASLHRLHQRSPVLYDLTSDL